MDSAPAAAMSFAWEDGKMTTATIHAKKAGTVTVVCNNVRMTVSLRLVRESGCLCGGNDFLP